MNAMFDIYGDKQFDYDHPVFVTQMFLKTLDQNLYSIQKKIKCVDKRTHGELRDRCDEALFNMREFIKYKRNE
jgi:hypothetical protein